MAGANLRLNTNCIPSAASAISLLADPMGKMHISTIQCDVFTNPFCLPFRVMAATFFFGSIGSVRGDTVQGVGWGLKMSGLRHKDRT